MPYVRPPAEDAAWAEDLANDVKAAQQQFDEALAEYRAAAEKVEALKGKTDLETTLAEQVAEKNLQNSRWGLARSQQRLAYSEQLNPAAQELRDAQAAMEEAMKAQDASWETYVEQFKRLQAAKEKYLEASSKKLSDFPANPMPSPGGGPAPDLPPPPPSGGGVCGGGTSASGGGSASGGSGASGGNAPNMSGTQDLGKTQPDMGSTMPGGRPGPTYAPVRYGQPSPSAPTRTMVGLGGMIGGS
jgi:hypothetical protein